MQSAGAFASCGNLGVRHRPRRHVLAPRAGVFAQDNATITGPLAIPAARSFPTPLSLSPILLPVRSERRRFQQRRSVSLCQRRRRHLHAGSHGAGIPEVHQDRHRGERGADPGREVTLAVGSQAQTVTVAADALQVQTETSEVSTLISGQQVESLPPTDATSHRLPRWGWASQTTCLVRRRQCADFVQRHQLQRHANQTHNIYMIDGGEQNDRGCGGCFMNLPSQDSIAEFQTLDSNYSPDYGIGSGGTIADGAQVRHQQLPRRTLLNSTATPTTTPTITSSMQAASRVPSSS